MQKWEYMTARAILRGDDTLQVIAVNGETQECKGPDRHKKCPNIEVFLAKAGEEGWELAGLGVLGGLHLVFKRPKN